MNSSGESHIEAPPPTPEIDDAPRSLRAREDSLPPIWNIRAQRSKDFIGRTGQLEKMEELLDEHGIVILNEVTPPVGGVGKSALAREYAFRHANEYQVVWWVQAEETGVLHFTYAQLMTALNLLSGTPDEPSHSIESVRSYLSKCSGWLLIIDGLDNLETLPPLLPSGGAGHVIVTAPIGSGASSYPCVSLDPFDEEDSAAFLRMRIPDVGDAQLEAITEQIDHNPLVLHLFTCYLAALKLSPEAGLEALHAKTPEPLRHAITKEMSKALLRVLVRMILDRLKQSDRAARDLAMLCSYLGPHDIPLFLLNQDNENLSNTLAGALSDEASRKRCLDSLLAFGLIEMQEDSLSMHELVQDAIRESLTTESSDAWANAAVRLVTGVFPFQPEYHFSIPACARLLTHSLAATQYAEEAGVARENSSHLLYYVGLYLYGRGAYAEAKTCYLLSITLGHKVFGATHPSFATRINSLGIVEHQLGNLREAKECFEKAFEICEKLFGPTHEAVYTVDDDAMLTMPIRNLCAVLEELGDIKAAQSAYERAMKIYLEVYGWNHPMVAECANRFGRTWHHLGRLAKARNSFEKAVMAEESAADSDTTKLATYLNNLGTVLIELEQAQLAHNRFTHALRLDRLNFEEGDLAVARDLFNLGNANRLLQRFDEAEDCYRKALAVFESSAEDDEQMTHLLSHLGMVLLERGDPAVARVHLERALKRNEQSYGEDAPELIRDLTNIGRALDALELHTEAMECFERALTILENESEEEGSKHATIHYRIGRSLHAHGDHADANGHLKRAMHIDSAIYGEQHQSVARDAFAIGCVLADLDDNVVAMGHLTLALDIYENTIGKTILVRGRFGGSWTN